MSEKNAKTNKMKRLPTSIEGRRIRSWHRDKVTVPPIGEEAFGRTVTEILRDTYSGEPVVLWKDKETVGACTLSRWKTWKKTGDELYTDWKRFFRIKEDRRRSQSDRKREMRE